MLYAAVKRMFDILASGLALLVLSPVWLIAIIGIELSDPGPVFYLANRVGKDNKLFKMFKFRSMRVDNSANEKNFKADTDRIFKFGALIRATKIDELPQLLNVFLGHMSVIGPRPAAQDQVDVVRAGKYGKVSSVKPGLSGPSALYDYIYGDTIEDEAEYEEKVLPSRLDLDLYYVSHRSIRYDVKMIVDTVLCILATVFGTEPKRIYSQLLAARENVVEEEAAVG